MSTVLTAEELKELEAFSQWILDVGDGVAGEPNDGDALITIPDEFLIMDTNDPIESISKEVYGDATALQQQKDPIFFQERAILCPTNEDMKNINVPTLIIHGDGDKIVPIKATGEQSSGLIKNSSFIIYPGAAHGLWYTEREQLNKDLMNFI